MNRKCMSIVGVFLACCLAPAANAVAEWAPEASKDPTWDFYRNNFLSSEYDAVAAAAAAVNEASTSRQTEAPALATNSTSLLDRSAAPDLLGLALNLAGLSGAFESDDEEGDANSIAIVTTAYAIQSAITAQDPLDSHRYCDETSRRLRRASINAAYDSVDDENESSDGDVDHATTVGFKYTIVDRRDACEYDLDPQKLVDAGIAGDAAVTQINFEVCRQLGEMTTDGMTCARFLNKQWASNRAAFERVNADRLVEIAKLHSTENTALRFAIDEAIERVRTAPQVAVNFNARLEEGDATTNVYSAKLVWEWGPNERWSFIGNLGGEYDDRRQDKTATVDTDDGYGAVAALQFEYKIDRTVLNLLRRKQPGVDTAETIEMAQMPIRWITGAKGEWRSEVEDTYSVQTKLVIPITSGLELPISITYASSSELIEEDEIRGQVGFTLDTSKLLDLL
jgi:hypothetical protein